MLYSANGGMPAIGDGGVRGVCVLPKQPSVVEVTAAEELASYLEKMGLQRPVIVKENEIILDGAFQFHIGWTERARKATGLSVDDMGADEYVVRVSSDCAVLAGHPQRGALYAVDHLLEKHCGVRWWSAAEEFVPVRKRLELPEINERIRPAFAWRRTDGAQFSGDKAAKEKVAWYNVHQKVNYRNIPEALGGAGDMEVLCGSSHTAERFVPDEAFFNARRNFYGEEEAFAGSKPEFFALRDGRRLGASEGQPCLSNPEVVEVAATNIIKLIARKNPQIKRVWLTQNDNTNYCECMNCMNAAKRLGNQSDLNIQFVNQVGERVRKVYPKVEFETFAYQYTLEPPKTVRPAEYVHVQVCLIEANTAVPLTHKDNRMLLNALKGWTAICGNVDVWCYTTNFLNYGLVHPVTSTIGSDIRLFQRLGVKECFCEEGPESGEFSWFAVWRGYLIAHLMVEPSLDATALRDDFFSGYYGPAAEPLKRLVDLYEQEAMDSGRIMTTFQLDTSHWLKAATLDKGETLLREAEAAVQTDSVFAKRIVSIRACQDWTRLWRHENTVFAKVTGAKMTDSKRTAALRTATLSLLEKVPQTPGWLRLYFKMGTLPLDRILPTLDGYLAPEPPHENLPKQLRRLRDDDFVIIPMVRYAVAEGERSIHDYKAPTKEATRLKLNSWRWVARIDLPALPPCGKWEILMEARLPDAVTAPKGVAVKTGVYALGTNFAVKTEVPIPADKLSRDEYRLFSLGTTDFHRDGQIYFAGVANESVPELLVGRVFLKRVILNKNDHK